MQTKLGLYIQCNPMALLKQAKLAIFFTRVWWRTTCTTCDADRLWKFTVARLYLDFLQDGFVTAMFWKDNNFQYIVVLRTENLQRNIGLDSEGFSQTQFPLNALM